MRFSNVLLASWLSFQTLISGQRWGRALDFFPWVKTHACPPQAGLWYFTLLWSFCSVFNRRSILPKAYLDIILKKIFWKNPPCPLSKRSSSKLNLCFQRGNWPVFRRRRISIYFYGTSTKIPLAPFPKDQVLNWIYVFKGGIDPYFAAGVFLSISTVLQLKSPLPPFQKIKF